MRVQCGLFNTGGKEGEMAVSSPLKRFQEELQGGQGVWPQIFQTRKSDCCCCKEQCFSLKLFNKVARLKHLENLGLGTCFQQESVRSVFQEDQTLENVLNRKM